MNEQQGLDPMFQENGSQWMEGTSAEPLNVYTTKTFGWMFLGLLVTFGTAIAFSAGGGLYYLLTLGMPAVFALCIAELVLVMVLSARLGKMSIAGARGLFFAYAILNGVTFSAVFFAYDVQILLSVFALTALYFGALAAYGWLTKRDLSGLGTILGFSVLFLLVFWVLSMFLPLGAFERIICFIGLAVFMGCTAYDTQRIKHLHAEYGEDYEMSKKASIFAALQLYLDFINIFLYILRLLGRRSSSN
ncbi:BAX inhibitor (BI)-1/YccA family protein [Subdoligranulum sp. AM23-21AC]|uniref:Bax inhibitor-1/YccA family protein n=1 Tax=Ruthenibacterium lactatiformans TaxID=1550024 RepID=UPI000E3F0C6E|nr:Bax inhibitor-1/YccA family protein [Ruthenibacterium lactatiformans]RGD21518.1 BAX inhibitor (BI)-1/YccA family protein [Subdoligranulum sp. AM23-21AC]RJW32001.1 BAX inhibitor (BI)-1/YccA family protein [Subdoligranulum sp. TF05-17AC]